MNAIQTRTLSLRLAPAWIGAFVIAKVAYLLLVQDENSPTPIDELLCLLLLPTIALGLVKRWRLHASLLVPFGLFSLIGIVSALLSPYGGVPQPLASLYDAALESKLLIVFLAFHIISSRSTAHRKDLAQICWIFVLLGLVNAPFVVVDLFSSGTGIHGQALVPRVGLFQPNGIFYSHTESVWVMLIASGCAYYLFLERKSPFRLLSLALITSLVVLHFSAKETIALFCAAFFIINAGRGSAMRLMWGAGLLGLVLTVWNFTPVGAAVSGQLSYYLGQGSEDMARTALTTTSVKIANDSFPLGSGAGTFASAPSYKLGYSDVYRVYGLDRVYGISQETGNFITDVFWPKILGQSGYIGLIAYLLFAFRLGLPAVRRYSSARSHGSALASMAWIAAMVISLASVPFNNEFFLIALGAFLAFARTEPSPSATKEFSSHEGK
ncbi:hypothetical protein [Stenotrophomonas sp. 24(2023)]|uniref:O-antigen ligase family protein n=1 Tax=Stenotrophomonas sp. 24(2023) TaxID=3068324 RepID=UPI0027E0989F|nr:hypothetical protein [Stenotrophomonas sp. 24(2023)]WMJ70872.1 hypothetical protein Q9R17_07180 [Stenotrophomonas sp. 24(2023)]